MTSDLYTLLILGTRTFAVEVADLATTIPGMRVAGFVENMERQRCGQLLEGLPVYWIDEVAALAGSHRAVCALSTTLRSRFVQQAEEKGLAFATLIHPAAVVSRQSAVGEGSILGAGSVVGSHSRLEPHVIVNRGALIGHHTTIGRFCSIQPGANVAGACTIGEATYVGMGAIVLDHITIGSHAVVGAGAVVTRDVPDGVQVMGIPARIVKENIEGR
jgi:sugar O-acyltransferase (sialic acid O-acetyltransferase NeuD family)